MTTTEKSRKTILNRLKSLKRWMNYSYDRGKYWLIGYQSYANKVYIHVGQFHDTKRKQPWFEVTVLRRFSGTPLPGQFYGISEQGPKVTDVELTVTFRNPTLASLKRGIRVFEDRLALMGVGVSIKL